MGIGENLKRLRTERRLSQKDLAGLSGVSQQLISQIERGENRTTKELPDLARALNVGVQEIDSSYATEGILSPRAAAALASLRGEHLVRAEELIIMLSLMQDKGVDVPASPNIRHEPVADLLPPPPSPPRHQGKPPRN